MNCEHIRELLPLLAYGDLVGDEFSATEAHLRGCPTCRAEFAGLVQVRRLLDESPTPPARFDRFAGRRDVEVPNRAARRWRMVALIGLAATILIAAVRLDIRIDQRQLVVRWGRSEPVAPVVDARPPQVIVRENPAESREIAERLKLLNELVHALAASVEAGDSDRREELAKLRKELDTIQEFDKKRWAATERDVSALYTAQFGARNSGANP
jgi:anti-sigma factor RsiW